MERLLILPRSYLPEETWILRSHAAAIISGEIVGGENEIITVDAEDCLPPL